MTAVLHDIKAKSLTSQDASLFNFNVGSCPLLGYLGASTS